jgi:hypothetical protein
MPIQNNVQELWSSLDVAWPTFSSDVRHFFSGFHKTCGGPKSDQTRLLQGEKETVDACIAANERTVIRFALTRIPKNC